MTDGIALVRVLRCRGVTFAGPSFVTHLACTPVVTTLTCTNTPQPSTSDVGGSLRSG